MQTRTNSSKNGCSRQPNEELCDSIQYLNKSNSALSTIFKPPKDLLDSAVSWRMHENA